MIYNGSQSFYNHFNLFVDSQALSTLLNLIGWFQSTSVKTNLFYKR